MFKAPPRVPDRSPPCFGGPGGKTGEVTMYLIHALVSLDRGRGIPAYSIWTTPDAERNGIPTVNSVVPLRDLVADGKYLDVHVGAALACSALGSRLLRLGSEIGSQQPLFGMDMLERSE